MRMCCFNTNIWQTFCDTDLTFCVMIAKEQGFFLRAKKSQTLVCPNGQPSQLIFYTCPDSMITLGQRWLKVVSSVGPTLDANVGPRSLCSSGERSAHMLGQRWPNVAIFSYNVWPTLRQHMWFTIANAKNHFGSSLATANHHII